MNQIKQNAVEQGIMAICRTKIEPKSKKKLLSKDARWLEGWSRGVGNLCKI